MNSFLNKERNRVERRTHPHPIPSLSFSLSTPPDTSPEDEESTPLNYFSRSPSDVASRPQLTESEMEEAILLRGETSPIDKNDRQGTPRLQGSAMPSALHKSSSPGTKRKLHCKIIEEPILENGEEISYDLGSSASSFLLNKQDEDALLMLSKSPTDSEAKGFVNFSVRDEALKDPEILSVASIFIEEVLSKAQTEANLRVQSQAGDPDFDFRTDPKLIEMVREFVSEVLTKAKQEAVHSYGTKTAEEERTNNNNIILIKEKTTLLSHARFRDGRRGPWYGRAIRFLSSIFGRMCPCKTPGEP